MKPGCIRIFRAALLLALWLSAALAADETPQIRIDPARVTVSGLSAGGQMAHQLHVAYADLFSGAGIIAGGPFGCADGSLATAFSRCIGSDGGGLSADAFAAEIRAAAVEGKVADPALLANDRVWLFHGALDKAVAAGVSDALAELYRQFVPPDQLVYIEDVEAAHHFPADGQGHACDVSVSPFVGDCGYDAAGEMLQQLYPGLRRPVDPDTAEPPEAPLRFPLAGANAAGLEETAYLYVPPACADRQQACALHLVLHGCAQSAAQVGTAFIEQSGYLPWVEANDILLFFPQVAAAAANPYACWDWWGYTGNDYRWREGAQMKLLTDWITGGGD